MTSARVSRERGPSWWSHQVLGAVVLPAKLRQRAGLVGLDYHGRERLLVLCEVCGRVAAGCATMCCRQCRGCGYVLHRICAGLGEWPLGPFHCNNCWKQLASKGILDVTLDTLLMHVVCGG